MQRVRGRWRVQGGYGRREDVLDPEVSLGEQLLPLRRRVPLLQSVHELDRKVALDAHLAIHETPEDVLQTLKLVLVGVGVVVRRPLVGYEEYLTPHTLIEFLDLALGLQILVRLPLIQCHEIVEGHDIHRVGLVDARKAIGKRLRISACLDELGGVAPHHFPWRLRRKQKK